MPRLKSSVPSIRAIALESGVSTFTVSIALKNDPRLPLKTRRRILRVAETMGYRPDPAVAQMMAAVRASHLPRAKEALAYVDASSIFDRKYDVVRAYLEGAQERCEQLGYRLAEFELEGQGRNARHIDKVLRARGIRGIVLFWPLAKQAPEVIHDIWKERACVALGSLAMQVGLSTVLSDHFHIGFHSVMKACNAGYGRVGLICNSYLDLITEGRFRGGFLAGSQKLFPSKDWLPVCPFTHGDEKELRAWVRRYRPDCMIVHSEQFEGVMEKWGYSVPRDMGLIHWDLNDRQKSHWSGFYQNEKEIGMAAVDLLVGQLHRHEWGVAATHKSVFVEGCWNDAETLGRR